MIKHIRRWNEWRKFNTNSKWYKLLVLLGLRRSPSMAYTLLPEERNSINMAFRKALATGRPVQKFDDI